MTSNTEPFERELYPYITYQTSRDHPDFQAPWIKSLLSAPDVTFIPDIPSDYNEQAAKHNTFFNVTLSHPTGIKARLSFTRPTKEASAVKDTEHCCLLALGPDLDGMVGRVHGGFSSLIMDQILGACAARDVPVPEGWNPPATATLTVDYKAPVSSNSVVLARGWTLKESSGRKVWVAGVLEDESGKVLATGKALFINPKGPPTAKI